MNYSIKDFISLHLLQQWMFQHKATQLMKHLKLPRIAIAVYSCKHQVRRRPMLTLITVYHHEHTAFCTLYLYIC